MLVFLAFCMCKYTVYCKSLHTFAQVCCSCAQRFGSGQKCLANPCKQIQKLFIKVCLCMWQLASLQKFVKAVNSISGFSLNIDHWTGTTVVVFKLICCSRISITCTSGPNMNGKFMQTFNAWLLLLSLLCLYNRCACVCVCIYVWMFIAKVCGRFFFSCIKVELQWDLLWGEMFCNVSCLPWCAVQQTTKSSEEKFKVTENKKQPYFLC